MGDIVRRKWMTMMDVHAGVVERVYGGPVGLIWEMLAGEEMECETGDLAERAGIGTGSRVLALLPGAGGAARRLSRKYGATVIGLVPVPQVVEEAVRRTEAAGLAAKVDFQQGNAIEMSFHDGIFDVVWGEDAWCYVVDRDRMVGEIYRVLKPGGVLAFTDWVQTGPMSDDEWHTPETFRIFPHLETVESYANILERNGFAVTGRGGSGRPGPVGPGAPRIVAAGPGQHYRVNRGGGLRRRPAGPRPLGEGRGPGAGRARVAARKETVGPERIQWF